MRTLWLETVDSTQRYLADALREGRLEAPVAVAAHEQTSGRGSRDNRWHGESGNLFVSFALRRHDLPSDLKLESASIYFAFVLKTVLETAGSEVWMKWPNDFYLGELKIGGAITTLCNNSVICGIGLNTNKQPSGCGKLDVPIEHDRLLGDYFELLEKKPQWKKIFSKFQLEFERSKRFSVHVNDEKISLRGATLLDDGAIELNGQRMYSLR